MTKSNQIYFANNLIGIVLNASIIHFTMHMFSYDAKSTVVIYLWGNLSFIWKIWLLTIPFKMLAKNKYLSSFKKLQWAFSPLAILMLWYSFILIGEIDILMPDFFGGYINRIPYGLFQLLVVLVLCFSNFLINLVGSKNN